MKSPKLLVILCLSLVIFTVSVSFAIEDQLASNGGVILNLNDNVTPLIENQTEETAQVDVADPLYYFNFVNFHINDKLYSWVLQPVASGYKDVIPEAVRLGVSNIFSNLRSPVNIVNNLLQLNLESLGKESFRFILNSSAGIAGIFDLSCDWLDICKREADFGQTLGHYGIGHGIYLVWPIIGPSSLRDTVGFAGDQLMSPPMYMGYFFFDFWQSAGAVAFEKNNNLSFNLGNYEALTGCAIDDPYLTVRDAYFQYRKRIVEKSFQ
jgi:phospholipid-binding lipoprotein MlaA